MKTTENTSQKIFKSEDNQGKFEIRVHKNCSQIQVEVGLPKWGSEVFFDTDFSEIKAIRDMLDDIIRNKKQN